MFVQSPGKSCITTYIITESGRDNRFLPAPPACCPEFVQSQSQAKYILLSSCHHQSHPAGSQTGEVRTEISGVSLHHTGTATYICHTAIQGQHHTQSPNIIHCPEEMEEVKSLVFSSAASSLSPHIKTDIVTLPLMYVNETLSAASPEAQFSSSQLRTGLSLSDCRDVWVCFHKYYYRD